MRATWLRAFGLWLLGLGLAISLVGCASPPREATFTPLSSPTYADKPTVTLALTRTEPPTLTLTPTLTPTHTPAPTPTNPVEPSPTGRARSQPAWWQPQPGLRWQWQLTGDLVLDLPVDVYDLDLFDVDAAVVDQLHRRGVRVICYISVGSYEDWRPDVDRFPPEVLGNAYEGWPGERWLDIRRIDALAPIMRARLDLCAAKGFDAVEPDNIMVYTEDTGFPITYEDNIRYARWLAEEAHARGLAIGLKNGAEMVPDLVDLYDFAITEEAFYYDFADAFIPFLKQGKAVFDAEYTDTDVDWAQACERSRALGFSTILKNRDLDAWVRFCDE
ncbi:MAG: endo alpha-1,4 polygalactosaminidase [Chloroflexi bacterium]|nr:endo alpha-1,4 polygalactosaminidase [Chloroflexota bacterium]